MASNVFGDPISDETCKSMLECAEKISRRDRAQVAMFLKNSKNKDVAAREHVEQLKERRENSVSTPCLIYNATGDTINFSHSHNWEGQFGSEYPERIENGQWGVLVHVSSRAISPRSNGAVVYHGKNEHGDERDWMLAWDNLSGKFCSHKVFVEGRKRGHYTSDTFDFAKGLMEKMKYPVAQFQDKWHECWSTVTVGNYNIPIVEAVFLTGAEDA